MKIVAPRGRDNAETLQIAYNGAPFDFATFGVTKVEVTAGQTGLIDSTTDAVSYATDQLTVKFGKLTIPAGVYHDTQIVVYSSAHPSGIVLIGPEMPSTIVLHVINSPD